VQGDTATSAAAMKSALRGLDFLSVDSYVPRWLTSTLYYSAQPDCSGPQAVTP
jgi:hypothetical protein